MDQQNSCMTLIGVHEMHGCIDIVPCCIRKSLRTKSKSSAACGITSKDIYGFKNHINYKSF